MPLIEYSRDKALGLKMPGTNQTFRFPTRVLQTILAKERETDRDGVERGFDLCLDREQTPPNGDPIHLLNGRECTGTVCSVPIKDCWATGNPAGSFHTHPRLSGGSGPSVADMLYEIGSHFSDSRTIFGCRTGRGQYVAKELRCDYLPHSKLPARWQYQEWVGRYIVGVKPQYDQWEQTGSPPTQGWEEYDKLQSELLPLFDTERVPLSRLRDVVGVDEPVEIETELVRNARVRCERMSLENQADREFVVSQTSKPQPDCKSLQQVQGFASLRNNESSSLADVMRKTPAATARQADYANFALRTCRETAFDAVDIIGRTQKLLEQFCREEKPVSNPIMECDQKYSYKQIRALAGQHDLPRNLTRKDQMCAELIKRGLL